MRAHNIVMTAPFFRKFVPLLAVLFASLPLSAAVVAPSLSPLGTAPVPVLSGNVLAAPSVQLPSLAGAGLTGSLLAPALTPNPVALAPVPQLASPAALNASFVTHGFLDTHIHAALTPRVKAAVTPDDATSPVDSAKQTAVSGNAFDGAKAPATRRDDSVVDDFFGTKVADPYRWLEDPNSAETSAWVEAQNAHTRAALDSIPGRAAIVERIKTLMNYRRVGIPSKAGENWVTWRNTGLQNQDILYKSKTLYGEAQVLLDPNTLSADGTAALAGQSFSHNGKLMAYSISRNGSDWTEWRVRDVATGKDLPDLVRWTKSSGASWNKDGTGFYYTRYPEPTEGDEYKGANHDSKVYFHALGTPQEQDQLIYERPDKPTWSFSAGQTGDGRYLVMYQFEGTEPKYRIFIKDLKKKNAQFVPLFGEFDAMYSIVDSDKDTFYVQTTNGAPRGRLIAVDARDPRPENWREILPQPEGRDVLEEVVATKKGFATVVMHDAHQVLKFYDKAGVHKTDAALPGPGSISGFSRRGDNGGYFQYSSYNHPRTVFHVNETTGKIRAFRRPTVDFDPKKYEVKQVFYPSKDGTKVPMFVVHKKGLKLDGTNPTYLYGYGGFNVSLNPGYSSTMASWLEMGGVYAVANLRGGGEYGQEWHDAGRLDNKQNVFDDFIAAAEYLIREKYTSTPKLAIGGGSNGGLLVGAVMTQRPELFGAAIPEVGVHDMLRFHLFTVGGGWRSDYGSSETEAGFNTLYKYSPLHNVKPGVAYPPTMVMTGDHDDRVVPAHSHKLTATLQAAQSGSAPILTRIETNAGHGAGTPLSKVIDEIADKWAFLKKILGMN